MPDDVKMNDFLPGVVEYARWEGRDAAPADKKKTSKRRWCCRPGREEKIRRGEDIGRGGKKKIH